MEILWLLAGIVIGIASAFLLARVGWTVGRWVAGERQPNWTGAVGLLLGGILYLFIGIVVNWSLTIGIGVGYVLTVLRWIVLSLIEDRSQKRR